LVLNHANTQQVGTIRNSPQANQRLLVCKIKEVSPRGIPYKWFTLKHLSILSTKFNPVQTISIKPNLKQLNWAFKYGYFAMFLDSDIADWSQ
jgi:hypothetical protein